MVRPSIPVTKAISRCSISSRTLRFFRTDSSHLVSENGQTRCLASVSVPSVFTWIPGRFGVWGVHVRLGPRVIAGLPTRCPKISSQSFSIFINPSNRLNLNNLRNRGKCAVNGKTAPRRTPASSSVCAKGRPCTFIEEKSRPVSATSAEFGWALGEGKDRWNRYSQRACARAVRLRRPQSLRISHPVLRHAGSHPEEHVSMVSTDALRRNPSRAQLPPFRQR